MTCESGDPLQAFICPSDSKELKEFFHKPSTNNDSLPIMLDKSTDSNDQFPSDLKGIFFFFLFYFLFFLGDLQTMNFLTPDMPLSRLINDAKLTPNSFKAFASPLKMIADGGPPRTPAKSSNDFHTPGSSSSLGDSNSFMPREFVSLDPVRDAEAYMFGMGPADTLQALFDHQW